MYICADNLKTLELVFGGYEVGKPEPRFFILNVEVKTLWEYMASKLVYSLIHCASLGTRPTNMYGWRRTDSRRHAYLWRGGDSVGLDPAHEEDGESFKVCGASTTR